MKYILRKAVLGRVPEIKITAKQYSDLEKARNILSNALAIEEKYEIVISNYLDFEREILNTTVEDMVRGYADYFNCFEVRLHLNIRLINLLTACRLYVDQLNQNVRVCIPNISNAKEIVRGLLSKEYDESKEYRFMEALRNYTQHRGIPVHWTCQGGRWTSLENDGLVEYYMEVASQRFYLEKDANFKKQVLAEMDEKVDLKAATRSYIETLSNIHESVRTTIAESVTEARNMIEDARHLYAGVSNGNTLGLSAFKISDRKKISSIPLLLDWDDVRVKLQERNRKLTNLRKRYVTGCIKTNGKQTL